MNACHRLPRLVGKTPQARLEKAVERCQAHWSGAVAGKKWELFQYDLACRTLLCELRSQAKPSEWKTLLPMRVAAEEWDLSRIDDVLPTIVSEDKRDSGGVLSEALGTTVALRMKYRSEAAVAAKLFPLQGRSLPGTFVLDCSVQPARLRIVNTLEQRELNLAGRRIPLAYDVYSPLQQGMGRDHFGELFSLARLFKPQKGVGEIGVYSLTPYQRGKQPLIVVHGLESDPGTWLDVVYRVWSDPELSRRYQVWYFLYPTGLPIPESAARLRESLVAARNVYDPQHQDSALDQMVLVGHSMGGVLSRWQLLDSGDTLWQAFFPGTTPESLPLGAAEKAVFKRHLVFKASSSVARAIFIAAPHRGSEVANRVGDWIVRFIKLPLDLTSLAVGIATLNTNLINPVLQQYKSGGQTSLETLRADWPAVAALDRLKIKVPHHSIIARFKPVGPLAESTDGAVPYKSAHLESAQSELVINGWHSCCRHPEAVKEVARILKIR
jgi:pimeloyl-ACP methyl ester carboxylesterase